MMNLGDLVFDGTPRIAVPFTDKVSGELIGSARSLGADIAELRIDLFSSFDIPYVLEQAARLASFPLIATIRSAREGGGWTQAEAKRLELFRAVIPKADAVDIELSSAEILPAVIEAARGAGTKTIVSFHDFKAMPQEGELAEIYAGAKAAGADIVKIAAMAANFEDYQRLAKFTIEHARDAVITIAMGSVGSASRILFPALGSLITFASLEKATAPGQLDLETTVTLLRGLDPRAS